jgi:hypothetical protein
MGHALGNNYGKFYSFKSKPMLLDLSFIVDSTNGNGLGVRSVKGQGVKNVYMNTGAGAPVGTPAMGTARSFAILGASAVTNTGSSVLTGNLGVTPGTSITGFPPGTFSGQEHVADTAAANAKASAQAAYTDLQARSSSVIATALDGQSLTAGVYSSGSGTFTLAQSGGGTLTLTGSATDIFVFQMATTLTTGAGGVPVITLAGGALASNVYWVVGSSATINSGSAGTFNGNIIAQASITDTMGGSINGSLIALTGAVTLSAAAEVVSQPIAGVPAVGNPNPAPGYALIELAYNYNFYNGGFSGFVSPLQASNIAINSTNLVLGNPYVIVSPGHAAAGRATMATVADVSGSLAGTWFRLFDAYGNTFIVWFQVSGIGSAPVGVSGTMVEVQLATNDSAATVGTKLAVILNGLLAQQLATPTAPAGVFSFTASGTTTVTAINTNTNPYQLPGPPADGIAPTGFTFGLSVDDNNLKDWQAVGLPKGIVPQIGASFIAIKSGNGSSTGLVRSPSVSGVNSVEVIGNPNTELAPIPQGGSPNSGGWVLVQFLANNVVTAPTNESVCGMVMYLEFGSKVGGNNEQ